MDLLSLTRPTVRYACYRARTYHEGGPTPTLEHLSIIGTIEALPGFTGWGGFGRAWDLGPPGAHDRIVKRRMTEEQEWNATLHSLAIDVNAPPPSEPTTE
jgi:hypothetical protein